MGESTGRLAYPACRRPRQSGRVGARSRSSLPVPGVPNLQEACATGFLSKS